MTTPAPRIAFSRTAAVPCRDRGSLLLLAACGPDIARQPQTARRPEDTQKDFGDLEVHYNAVRTDQLAGRDRALVRIERSQNRAIADGRDAPVNSEGQGSRRSTAQ
jgi:hypothetical protein